jgi:hypothetical protein
MWHTWKSRKSVHSFGGKSEGKGQLERPRHRWEDGIKINLRKSGCEGVYWMHLAGDRDLWWAPVNTVINLWVLASLS